MSGTEKFLAVIVGFVALLNMTECAVQVQEREADSACEAACAPMAYTGFHDEGGCWCHVEDPNTLKRGK